MKKFLKVVGKTILVFFALTLTIALVGLTTAYSCRNIAKKHINEQYIRETINKIDYGEFLKEELPMDEIKKELQESNIDPEIVDKILEQEIINEGMDTIINYSIDYIVYGKEFDKTIYSEESINKYFDDNIDEAIEEINKISEEEKITEKEKQEIVNVAHQYSGKLSEEIDKAVIEIENALEDTDEYKELERFQHGINRLNDILDFAYGKLVTMALLFVILVVMLLIAASRRSIVNSLSWSGVAFIITGILFMLISVSGEIFIHELFTQEVPKYATDMIKTVFNNVKDSINAESIKNTIIGILLISSRIIIKKSKKKELI